MATERVEIRDRKTGRFIDVVRLTEQQLRHLQNYGVVIKVDGVDVIYTAN